MPGPNSTIVRAEAKSIGASMIRLSEQTLAIGEIIAAVNDLAEQSNILAVNASIEAAKAGEQGKGFAVATERGGWGDFLQDACEIGRSKG